MLRLLELAARRRLAIAYVALPLIASGGGAIVAACYSIGDGTAPPPNTFYFPVGMVTSKGGNVLYVVNSDFDLQWNGGTIQSYNLWQIRVDAAISAAGYTFAPQLPFSDGGGLPLFLDGGTSVPNGGNLCDEGEVIFLADGGLNSSCAPVINSAFYEKDSVIIGAFATDLQLSPAGNRLYSPVRGDASLTWLTVTSDVGLPPPATNPNACDSSAGTSGCYAPFTLVCGQANNGGRCDATHHAGQNPNEPGNTRNLTMPGEPFAMAQIAGGTAIILTHQTEGDTSLFLTGLTEDGGQASPSTPSMQFVVDAGLPMGGDGIAEIPHDPILALVNPALFPNPAALETNNTAAQSNVIRYYPDDMTTIRPDAAVPDANILLSSSLPRPFIEVERTLAITSLSSGTNSRGIAFDTSDRLRCEHVFQYVPGGPLDSRTVDCAKIPARMFIANRSPPALILGTAGGPTVDENTYDADEISFGPLPTSLDLGPSRVYLAPIINADGNYQLKVFVVCFDGNAIDVVDPVTGALEASIPVGGGPFAMAFDPFDPLDVALNRPAQPAAPAAPITYPYALPDGGTQNIPLPKYRFAYVASFTNSFVQVIDLDDHDSKSTFESVVYTLGTPSIPKGNQ
jgi:hypothetical protein